MKLYYSERTAIINPPRSVENVVIKVAKKILMYYHYMVYATSLPQDTLVVRRIPRQDPLDELTCYVKLVDTKQLNFISCKCKASVPIS